MRVVKIGWDAPLSPNVEILALPAGGSDIGVCATGGVGTATTGGAGNIPVSIAEDVVSTVLSILAIILPILALILVVVLLAFIARRLLRTLRRREAPVA